MSTKIKPELSKRNKYYIPKYRYYELKYRCLQYNDWLSEQSRYSLTGEPGYYILERVDGGEVADPTFDMAERLAELQNRISQIWLCLYAVDKELQNVIFEAVTTGAGWSVLQARYGLTCTKEKYYENYHKFFYILSKELA